MNVYRDLNNLPHFTKCVVTIGSFDGVHLGHQKILDRLKLQACELGGDDVIITFEPHPRSVIFPKDEPIKLLTSLDEKLRLFQEYGVSNVVVCPFTVEFSQLQPREYIENFLIKYFNPSCVIIGYDHRFGLNRGGDMYLLNEYAKEGKFDLIEIPKHEIDDISISSTKVRKAIENGDFDEATHFLGGFYHLTGQVVKGDSFGARIGFPTANIRIPIKHKLLPRNGIYAATVDVGLQTFEAMLYIGHRPTIEKEGKKSIEVNILNFNENIYNEVIRVNIIAFEREDIHFDNIDDMVAQMHVDKQNIQRKLKDRLDIGPRPICSIAVLNYNGDELLQSYLNSINYSTKRSDVEIVLVDNASTDGSVDYVKEWHPEVKILRLSKNYGYAEAYNIAIKYLKTPYVALLNSDVKVVDNWLDGILERFEKDRSIASIQPKIRSIEDKKSFEYAGASGGYLDILGYPFCRGRLFETVETDTQQYDTEERVFWTSGAAMVVRSEAFRKLGGFDGDYFAHQEEIDLCWRFNKAGYKCLVIPSSTVYHLGGGTLDYQSDNKIFLNFRNNLNTILKNEDMLYLPFTILFRLILDGLAGINFIREGKLMHCLAIIKAHLAFYANIIETVRKRISYGEKITRHTIDAEDTTLRYNGSIVWDYFVRGRKTFDQLNFRK